MGPAAPDDWGVDEMYDTEAIQQALAAFPNAHLTVAPTPVHTLPHLSDELSTSLYVKREDMTGFTIGGNKVRKLDYLIGDAVKKGADTLITYKASNFSRNAAVAAAMHGLDFHIIAGGGAAEQNPLSEALFAQAGATMHYAPTDALEDMQALCASVAADLQAGGATVYELHSGGSDEIGTLGFVNVFDEIVRYSAETGVHFSTIFHSTGSCATQAGLALGQAITGYETRIIGIAAARPAPVQTADVAALAASTADMLGVPFNKSLIEVDDGFIGPGYAVASDAGREAANLFARHEGVLLDDVYTAKAAAGLIDYARSAKLEAGAKTLFIHTGGNWGLFYKPGSA